MSPIQRIFRLRNINDKSKSLTNQIELFIFQISMKQTKIAQTAYKCFLLFKLDIHIE